jgi:hypothetical protein
MNILLDANIFLRLQAPNQNSGALVVEVQRIFPGVPADALTVVNAACR